jgi:hypothetical protein
MEREKEKGKRQKAKGKKAKSKQKEKKPSLLFAFYLLPFDLFIAFLLVYSPTYGSKPMNRARFTAVLTSRWNAAHSPLRLRLNSLPWLVMSFLRLVTSL